MALPLAERPGWKLQMLWLALAASASALLLSITHYVSQNIAAIPLLWIARCRHLPSLILVSKAAAGITAGFSFFVASGAGGMAYGLAPKFENTGPEWQIPLYFAGLFICCMVCHGEMAA